MATVGGGGRSIGDRQLVVKLMEEVYGPSLANQSTDTEQTVALHC
jgi:hypothetical protein